MSAMQGLGRECLRRTFTYDLGAREMRPIAEPLQGAWVGGEAFTNIDGEREHRSSAAGQGARRLAYRRPAWHGVGAAIQRYFLNWDSVLTRTAISMASLLGMLSDGQHAAFRQMAAEVHDESRNVGIGANASRRSRVHPDGWM